MDDEVFGIVTQRLKSEQQAARDEVGIGASDLEKAAKRMRAEAEAARLRQTALQTQGSTPDAAARAQKLGRDMGLPAGVVERNMAEVERQAELRRLDEVATQNPEMAGFLAVPENYSVSRDVLDELTKVADVARSLPAGALKGVGGAVAGTGALIDAGARTIDRGVRGMLGDRVADAFWFEGPDELNPAALLRGAGKAVKSLGADVGVPEDRQNTATDIAEGVGQLATQIAALILSRGSLGIPMLWGQGADQQAEKQEKVGAYGTAGGDAAIFAGGAVTALTEKFGLDYLMRKLPENVRSGIMQKLKDVFLSAGAEALQEVTEGILQNVVEYLFYNPDAEILEDFSREAIAAGGAAGIVRSVILAATGGKGAARARKAKEDAQRDAEALKAINQLAETSTLRERSPEKFGEFVRGLLNPEQAVEIDAQTAVELFQSQPNLAEVLPPDVAETLQRDLAIAQQTGADVRMRLSDFVVAFSGTEQFDTLADNVRLSTDALTLTEAAELSEEEAQQQLNMIRDEMASAIGGVNAAQTIFDDVFAQLKRAAVDDIAATQYAALVAARVRTRAERLGVDAVALYQTNRPLIVRDLGQKTGKAFDALELTLDDLRSPSRISERTAFGQTLVEFLAARGGLLDQGGELKAMDAHLWHKAQRGRRKLVVEQATGSKLTLDEAARAAWEAGYFPEMTDRPSPDDLLAAIERELKGEAVYAPRNRNEQLARRLDAMGQLDEALNVLGIDAKTATAEQVREAMDRYAAEQEGRPLGAVGRVLEQAGAPQLPATIEVDGVARPTTNSEGRPIAQTEDEVRAFWRWFGDSKVVDAEGRPLVVYHGGHFKADEFSQFRMDFADAQGDMGAGIYFSSSKSDAEGYDYNRDYGDPQTIAAYLRMENPYVIGQTKQINGLDESGEKFRAATEAAGFDGIVDPTVRNKFKDEGYTPDAVHYVAFRPEQAKSATGNRGTFDPASASILEQADGGGPRGSIRFLPDGRQLITLTAKADLSTFLHEMSHGWLEELRADAQAPNAPAQVKADWKRTAAYLGIDPNVRVIPTEAHETWARTGEAYFREGRAPAAELSSVFSRFKGWLVRIYRTLSDLRVPINDEIRGVFDRLVATDEEIEAVRQQYQFGGLFAEAAAAGMTEAEFKAYQDIAARAGMIAEQQVLDRLQRDAERTQRAEYLEAREAIGNEVEAQVRAEPVYRAISTLASDEALQLDQKALRDLYGARIVKRLPRGTTKKGGVSPDMVAPMFGFTSGDEMVKAMLGAAPIQQEIADRIEARMREQFPDAKSDGRAHEAAVEAMHGDAQLEVLELEFEALKRLGAGRIVEAAVRRKAAGQKAQKAKDVEADAQAQQEDEAIRVRAGVDAGVRAAAAAGRTRVAAQGVVAKQQRMDQAQARRVAVDALTVDREAIEKAADATVGTTKVSEILDTQRWRRAEKMAANAVVQAVAARDWGKAAWHQRQRIIAAHMVRRSVAARAEIERAIERFKRYQSRKPGAIDHDYLAQVRTILEAYQFGPKMSDRTRTILALRQIARWQAALQQDQSAMLEIAPEVLEADAKTHYRDMTLEEFQALRDTVESIATVGRTKTRLLRNQAERDLNRTAALVGETISRNAKERGDRGNVEKGVGYKARQLKDSFFATHRKIESLIREFDGFAALGPVWQALFKPLQDAQNEETRMSIAATKAIKALFEKFPEDARKGWRTRTTYYPEIGQSLSKATVLALALNWGNEGNREAIRKGFRWSDAQVQAVLDKALTAEDAAFIQSVWDYIDSFWPQLAALEKRVKGVEPVKVDAEPLTIAGVALRGGYYPLKYDPDRSEKAYSFQVDKMAQQLMSGAVAKASTRTGAAIERVGSGGMPVRLELDVLFEHVGELIHDISHREAILDVVRLLDHPEVKGAILDTKGPQFHRAMKDWVRDIAAGDVPALNWFDKVIQHLRGGMSISAMGWKLTTALVQPTGFFQSAAALPKGALLKSVSAFYAAPWGMAAKTRFVFDRSVEMRTRSQTLDRDIRDQLRRLGPGGRIDDVKRSFFYLTGLMDMGVAVPTWIAAYEVGMDQFGGDEAKAIDYADQLVRTTQSSGLQKDLAGIQRGDPKMKMFTAFYSYFSATYNLMVEESRRVKRPANMPRFVANMVLLTMLPAVTSELLMGKGPEGDDEDDEKWAKWVAATTLKYALSGFVGVRDIVNGLGSNFGYAGSPVGSAAEAMVKLGKQLGEGEGDRALLKAAVDVAGPVLHLPSRQLWITAEGIYLWSEGAEITPFEMFVTRDSRKFR